MRILKIVLAALGAVLALAVVAAVILVKTFDPNDYKDELSAYVEARTGRTLTIGRDIELSMFPWFAVETGGIALGDDARFGERSFVTIDELSARVRVWPLLRRRVEIGRVVLDGVDVSLAADAGGANWQSLLRETRARAPAEDRADGGAPVIERLAVEGIALDNARIRWHDASGEVRYIARDVNLETGRFRDDEPVEVGVTLAVLDVASQATAEIELRAVATVAPVPSLGEIEATVRVLDASTAERAAGTLTLETLRVSDDRMLSAGPARLDATLNRPPVGPETLEIGASFAHLALDATSGSLRVDGLRTELGGIRADVSLSGSALFDAPSLAGSVTAQGSALRGVFEAFALPWPEALADDTGGAFSAEAAFALALAPLALELDGIRLEALGLSAAASAALDADRELTATLALPTAPLGEPLAALLRASLPADLDLSPVRTAGLELRLAHRLGSDRLAIDDLSLAIDTARLAGNLTLDGLAKPNRIAGNVEAAGLDNRLLAALLGPWLPAALLEADLGEFALATGFGHDAAARVTTLDPLSLSAYGLEARGRLTARDRDGALALEGRAELDTFSPRALLARFDLPEPASRDPAALRSARLAAGFTTTGSSGEFRDIVVELDDSSITGEFAVENFADPSYRFTLRADRIDVDRYLPPPAEAAEADERSVEAIEIATDPLTATRVTGHASVGELSIAGLTLEQVSTELAVGEGRGRLDSVRARLYGGEFAGRLAVDASGETKRTELEGTLANVSLAPLLTALLGDSNLSGTGRIELDLAGSGDTVGDILETAAGTMNVALTSGQVRGFNLERTLCAAFNAADRLPAPTGAPDVTVFTGIQADTVVRDGVASTSNLVASTGKVAVTGQGTMRLSDRRIDFDMRAELTQAIALDGCARINSQVGGSFPFTLEGTLPNVIPKPDLSQYLRDRVNQGVRDLLDENRREAIEERLRDLFR